MVDIATSWTEQRAVWGKGEANVLDAATNIEQALPFAIRGFDCDNGSEFLNWPLFKHFTERKRPVQFTRSREYHKNDNAHIEGKNRTIVRQYLGYERFDDPRIVPLMNDLYTTQWRLLLNVFMPSVKLIEKRREGSKTIKRQLSLLRNKLNPFDLQRRVVAKIKRILRLATGASPLVQKAS